MNTITYFNAFKEAEAIKSICRVRRGHSFGIAVDADEYARRWQRRDRQARKFEARLRAKLEGAESIVREFVYPGSPKTPAQREALEKWEGLLGIRNEP